MRYKLDCRSLLTWTMVFLLGLTGCSSLAEAPPPQDDDFMAAWRELATPPPPVVAGEPVEPESPAESKPPQTEEQVSSPPVNRPLNLAERTALLHEMLPVNPVSIHLVDVPIGTALRSLARVARQNIMINPSVVGSVNVHVEEVPWRDVFMGIIESYGLVATKDGEVLRVMSVDDLRRQVERKSLHLEEEQVSPLVTRVLGVHFSDPAEIAVSLQPMLSRDREGNPRGSVSVDRHTRSLVLRDTSENLDRLAFFVGEIDKVTPQVLIEAHIIETTQDVARALGVQWGSFWQGGQRLSDVGGGYSYQGGNMLGQQYGVNLEEGVVNFVSTRLKGNVLELQLAALQKAGKIRILSRPSITTLDNHEAKLETGTEVPYQTIEDGTLTVLYKDAVLRLLVTPQVISSDQVKLKIEANKDEVDLTRTVAGNPFIIKKLASTNLVVENGATVVIAGLSKESRSQRREGVPLLQDVPGLGEFFQKNSTDGSFEELLIFITPRILNES